MTEWVLRVHERDGTRLTLQRLSVVAVVLAVPLLATAAVALVRLAEADRITNTQGLVVFVALQVGVSLLAVVSTQRATAPVLNREVHRLEAALAGQQDANQALLDELDRRRRFLVYVHHELRTPVTVIHGVAEVLAHHDVEAGEIQELAMANLRQTRRLRELVENLTNGASDAIENGMQSELRGAG